MSIRIQEIGGNGNGPNLLDLSGMSEVNGIYLNASDIIKMNLAGLTNLSSFGFSGNSIESLDFSGLTNLSQVLATDCSLLASITLRDNGNLDDFETYGCSSLTTLDLSPAPNLTYIDVSACALASLNLSGLTAVETLYVQQNNLTTLDVSDMSSMVELQCYDNNITSLDLSGLSLLSTVVASGNDIATLDVTGCTGLGGLILSGNLLTTIDLTDCAATLTQLYIDGNLFTTLSLSDLAVLTQLSFANDVLTTFSLDGLSSLESIEIGDMPSLVSSSVIDCDALTSLTLNSTAYTTWDLTDWPTISNFTNHDSTATTFTISDPNNTLFDAEFYNCDVMTDLTIEDSSHMVFILIEDSMPDLVNLTLTNLTGMSSYEIQVDNLLSLVVDNCSLDDNDIGSLTDAVGTGGALSISNCAGLITTETVATFGIDSLTIDNCNNMTDLELFAGDFIYFSLTNCSALVNLSVPGNYDFITLIFDNLPSLIDIDFTSESNLVNVTASGLDSITNFNLSGCKLTQASVDSILAACDANGLSTGSVDVSGGTSATPSAAGIISAASLTGKGWTIATN